MPRYTTPHKERCQGCPPEHKARKGMVAVVSVTRSYVSGAGRLLEKNRYQTHHVGLVDGTWRCGHVKVFKGLTAWELEPESSRVDTKKKLDPEAVMDALEERGSDTFETVEDAVEFVKQYRAA